MALSLDKSGRSTAKPLNIIKNRTPTDYEAEVFRNMIQDSETRLSGINIEINKLQAKAEEYHAKSEQMVSVIQVAQMLKSSTEITISSLGKLQRELSWEDTVNRAGPTADSVHPSHSQLCEDDKHLRGIHEAHRQAAQSALKRAKQQIAQAEEDIDVNHSLLSHVEEILLTLIHQRKETKKQIKGMKDMVGARRRTPNELWLQIFNEVLNGSEGHYISGQRNDTPPFTALKLTWVCRRWRELVMGQPSLWRYIALPYAISVSPKRRDRILHYIEHLKLCPPTMYVAHWDAGIKEGYVSLAEILKRIPRFERLELPISASNTDSEALLATVQPNAVHLVLVSRPSEGPSVTPANLAYTCIQKVQHVSCLNVRPQIRGHTQPLHLKSLHLTQPHIDNVELVTFLEATSVVTVTIEMYLPFMISGSPAEVDITLPNLTTLTTNLFVLVTLFNDHVFLPNLHTLTMIQQRSRKIQDIQARWTSFITTHQCKDTIRTLGISSPHRENSAKLLSIYQDFITQVKNVKHLVLDEAAVILGLNAMVNANYVPSTLIKLTISKSSDVTKEEIDAFSKVLNSARHEQLSLRIEDCPSLSDKTEDRLILDHNAAQKP
ncbi:hypothetical protein CPB86DRAFT_759479 [Serendipita vermifera]|nr:hypothetical protein CPB86DRAFT_759479 [Serendipita vermifera]